jgi:hypothetical protein
MQAIASEESLGAGLGRAYQGASVLAGHGRRAFPAKLEPQPASPLAIDRDDAPAALKFILGNNRPDLGVRQWKQARGGCASHEGKGQQEEQTRHFNDLLEGT